MILNDNLICLPVICDEGLDSKLSKHFGRAPYHLLVDTETGKTELLIKLLTGQGKGQCRGEGQGLGAGALLESNHHHCQPVEPLLNRKVGAVLCQGFGRGAYRKLLRHGISVWITKANTVGEALDELKSGKLLPVHESQLCNGGHHH